jgi:hypothetical protein
MFIDYLPGLFRFRFLWQGTGTRAETPPRLPPGTPREVTPFDSRCALLLRLSIRKAEGFSVFLSMRYHSYPCNRALSWKSVRAAIE